MSEENKPRLQTTVNDILNNRVERVVEQSQMTQSSEANYYHNVADFIRYSINEQVKQDEQQLELPPLEEE